jgi:hypothetical protein
MEEIKSVDQRVAETLERIADALEGIDGRLDTMGDILWETKELWKEMSFSMSHASDARAIRVCDIGD